LIADKGPTTPLDQLEKEKFLDQFMEQFQCLMEWGPLFIGMEQKTDAYDVAWWVRSQDESSNHPNCPDPTQHAVNVDYLFSTVHKMASRKIMFH
jgi:hypothetical protein